MSIAQHVQHHYPATTVLRVGGNFVDIEVPESWNLRPARYYTDPGERVGSKDRPRRRVREMSALDMLNYGTPGTAAAKGRVFR
jgi:hypothetical protein